MPPAKPLWKYGLDSLLEDIGDSTHWMDRDRAFELARGLRIIGERPSYRDEVSPYIGQLWQGWRWTASMVRDCWRTVDRADTSRGRARTPRNHPLYVPDMLIAKHRLRPTTEARLASVARDAVDALARAAPNADAVVYRRRKREMAAALAAVDELRVLRESRIPMFDDFGL
jgi:hypothetical protein